MDYQLDVLNMMAMKPRREDKENLLREIDPKILKAALDPSIRYYLNVPTTRGAGTNQLNDMSWRILAVLSDRSLSGTKAKNVVTSHIHSLTPKSGELFKRILLKDLRCGAGVKMVNRVYPNLIGEFGIMLAEPFDEKYVDFPCWVSPKIDGNRVTYDKGIFFSRSGKQIHGLEQLERGLKHYQYDKDWTLDGELRDSSTTFQKSSGLIRSKDIKRGMTFFVFDIPSIRGPANARYAKLDFLSFPNNVQALKHNLVHSLEEIYKMYDLARKAGFEGVMVKSYGHFYQRKRSHDWLKIKASDAMDLEVVRVVEGTGKYLGSLGAAVVLLNGEEVSVTPAMDDKRRKYYWIYKNHLLGKTIEVMFQERTADGKSLRHPRFRIVRDDK
jgi:DNA ligase 1